MNNNHGFVFRQSFWPGVRGEITGCRWWIGNKSYYLFDESPPVSEGISEPVTFILPEECRVLKSGSGVLLLYRDDLHAGPFPQQGIGAEEAVAWGLVQIKEINDA